MEKLCTFCRHCQMNTDGYETSGYYAVIECNKDHWHSQSGIPGRDQQLQAMTCPDYKEDA